MENNVMQYWVIVDKERQGPMSMDELIGAGVTATTYVWRKGMKTWLQASQVEELKNLVIVPNAPLQDDIEDVKDNVTHNDEETNERLQDGYSTEEDAKPVRTAVAKPKPEQRLAMPSTYLTFSVFTTIFCCLPLGMLATIYSLKVEDYYEDGKLNRSYRASRNALWMNVVSLILTMTAYIVLLTALLCILSLNGALHSLWR